MDPISLRHILSQFCEEMDRAPRPTGHRLRVVATAAGLALGLSACEEPKEEVDSGYGAPFETGQPLDDTETSCTDQIDNDGDSLLDCDDDDCIDDIACQGDLYRAPPA